MTAGCCLNTKCALSHRYCYADAAVQAFGHAFFFASKKGRCFALLLKRVDRRGFFFFENALELLD